MLDLQSLEVWANCEKGFLLENTSQDIQEYTPWN